MVHYTDYLESVRAQYGFNKKSQTMGQLGKILGVTKKVAVGAFQAGKKAYETTAPIVIQAVEEHKKTTEEAKKQAKAIQKFNELRQSVSSGLEDAARRIESARARGWEVTIENTDDVRVDNYGKYVEISEEILAGTNQVRMGYIVDPTNKRAYSY